MNFNRSRSSHSSLCLLVIIIIGLIPQSARAEKCVGINDHIIWRTNAQQDIAFTKYADSGTKFLRVGADWNVIETSKNVYSSTYLARLDYFFQKANTAGIRVLLIAAYAPSWANGGNSGSGYAPSSTKLQDYADFCEFLLRRYATATYTNASGQHTLEAIELWNEPDLADIYFKPYARYSAAGGTAYGNLVVAAGSRLQSIRGSIGASDVKIVAPCVSEVHSVCYYPWMDSFYAVSGVTAYYDVFAWHSYWMNCGSTGWLPPELPACWNPSSQRQAILGKLTANVTGEIWPKMVANGDNNKPNWCTETGGAARSGTADHPNRLLSFAEQQTLLGDLIGTLNSGNVTNLDRVYWYELLDEPQASASEQVYGLIALNSTNPIAYSGETLQTATFTPKSAYTTYKNASKGGELFSDDFSDGNDAGWTSTPSTWTVTGTEYHSPHNAATGISSAGDSAWTNYSVQAKLKFNAPWKSAGLLARYNGTNGYYLRVGTSSTTTSYSISLLKGTTVLSTVSINNLYNFTQYHTVQFSVKTEGTGCRILGVIDGNQHINYLDSSSPYTSGKIGVRAEPWTGDVYIDDVLVLPN